MGRFPAIHNIGNRPQGQCSCGFQGFFRADYVVPVIPDDGQTERIHYYTEHEKKDARKVAWIRVAPKNLNSKIPPFTGDLIKLVQPTPAEIHAHTTNVQVDLTVSLFAAVAKTLGTNSHLPNLYSAQLVDGRPTMVLPVTKDTGRGLILIFTQRDIKSDVSDPRILKLMASTDPEIKNSTDGLD